MKIIAQSVTPSKFLYYHLAYQSASQNPGMGEGGIAFIITVIFLIMVKAFMRDKVVQCEIKLNNEGNQLFNDKKYDEALECFEKAIKQNKYYEQSYFNKGHVFIKLNKNAEAIKSFQQYLELAKNVSSAQAVKEIINNLSKEEIPS